LSPEPDAPLVSVVIVSYNTRPVLERCLDSVARHAGLAHEIIVVDNNSTDGTVEALAPLWPTVNWVVRRDNPGFARANNQGFALARAPYWLVLNPDTELRPGALPALLAYLESHHNCAAVGPEVERPDGSLEFSAGWAPAPGREIAETFLLFRLGLEGRLLRHARAVENPVDWLSGCAMLVRAAAAHEVGPFDEHFFLYVEDLEWGMRFRRAGWDVVHLRGPRVLHLRGESVLASDSTLVDGGDGLDYVVRKHGLRFPLPLLRTLRIISLATRWGPLALRGARGDKRGAREARLFARSLRHALGLGPRRAD
jgi:N-acetylglucosaminyl-diphospho-decaprenol L-rhamnosyltransferase